MLYQFIEVASCEISAADATLEQNCLLYTSDAADD